jgi:hypothetical protein
MNNVSLFSFLTLKSETSNKTTESVSRHAAKLLEC